MTKKSLIGSVVDRLTHKGWNIQNYTERRTKQSPNNIYHTLKKNYYGGTCLKCNSWPYYTVLIDVGDGATVRRCYCEKHLPKF